MEITEIRVRLMGRRNDKLRALCSATFDNSLAIHDLKVIDGAKGQFVAMPSRKLTDRCPRCGGKNHLQARFCNDCGAGLATERAAKDGRGRPRLHADVAHPIHAAYREALQARVLQAFHDELERSKLPGYRPASLGDEAEEFDDGDGAGAVGAGGLDAPALAARMPEPPGR